MQAAKLRMLCFDGHEIVDVQSILPEACALRWVANDLLFFPHADWYVMCLVVLPCTCSRTSETCFSDSAVVWPLAEVRSDAET